MSVWDVTQLLLSTKTKKAHATDDDGMVSLYAFGSDTPSFSYFRHKEDVHFVSHWLDYDDLVRLEPGRVIGVAVAQDHKKALLGYDDGLLYLADLVTGQMRRINSPDSIKELIDAKYRRFSERGCRSKVPDSVFRRKQGPRYSVSQICMSGDGRYAATVCHGEKVRVWSVETGGNISSLGIPFGKSLTEGEVGSICFSSNGETLIILRSDHWIMAWKFLHSKKAKMLKPPLERGISVSKRYLAEYDGTVAAYLGGWVVNWSNLEDVSEPVARLLGTYPWGARINLRSRSILSWDVESGPSKMSIFDFDSLQVIAQHNLTSDGPIVSNLADDGSFVVGSRQRGLEFFELVEGKPLP